MMHVGENLSAATSRIEKGTLRAQRVYSSFRCGHGLLYLCFHQLQTSRRSL